MTADKNFKRLVRERAHRTGESYASARRRLLRRSEEASMASSDTDDLVVVTLNPVVVETAPDGTQYPLVALQDATGRRLTFLIGHNEATAIAWGLEHVEVARPMTHDLLTQAVAALDGHVRSVVIDHDLESGAFTADLTVRVGDGRDVHLDGRPSDALAPAVRCDPPPVLKVPTRLLDDPPPGITATIKSPNAAPMQLRCACGSWSSVSDEELRSGTLVPSGKVEVITQCSACSRWRRVRVIPPTE